MDIKECYKNLGADYNDVLTRLMNEAFIIKFVKKFLTTTEYDNLIKAKNENNKPEVYRTIHTIKGMALNLSFTKLFSVSNKFCEEYKKQDFTNYDENVDAVIDEYLRTKKIIEELD